MSYVRAIEDEIRDHYDKEFKREFELLEAEHQKELEEEREKADAERKKADAERKKAHAERESSVKNFYKMDLSVDEIAKAMNISTDDVLSIVQEEIAPYETD